MTATTDINIILGIPCFIAYTGRSFLLYLICTLFDAQLRSQQAVKPANLLSRLGFREDYDA